MTHKEKSEHAQRLLAAFTRQIKHYKAVWQVPPDKMVTQACWAAAKREVPGRSVSPTDGCRQHSC